MKHTDNIVPVPTRGRILLVDDDKFLLEMYAQKFTQQGFIVHSCFSAREALEILQKHEFMPDAILLDLVMPEMDGFALLGRIQSEHLAASALKIALSNQSDELDQSRAQSLGADRFLIKATLIPSEVVNIVAHELLQRKAK